MRRGHSILLALGAAVLFVSSATGATTTLWFKLDETSGSAAADSSGNANNGTYTGGPTLGAAAPHRLGTYFAANGQYVIAPASATLNALGASNADFSVAFWINPNGTTGGWRPLLHKGAVDTQRGPGLWLNPGNNRIHFRVSTTANYNEGTDSIADLPNGTWSHIACVKAANKWRCYVNGVLDTEFTLSAGTIGNSGPLYVGDDPWYGGSKAWMDDVRLYSGALTLAEVKNLYGEVGFWKLNETAGTTAADSTSAGNTGTYTNGPALNQSGVKNTAVSFDGSNDYVGIPDSSSLKATDSVTMAAWVRPSASTNVDRIIVNKEGEYEMAISNTNEIKWAFANTSPGWTWHQTGKFIPNDTWSHVVVTYDGVEAKTYLNGVLVETYAGTGNVGDTNTSLNELRIAGCSNSPAGKYFAGSIDDVYVYTRAINALEVASLYGLIGQWKLAESSGATAADSTVFGRNATLTGSASWSSDCGGMGAFDFNGVSHYFSVASAADLQPTGMISICAWIKGDTWGAGSDVDIILRKGDASPNNYALEISDGKVEFLLNGTEGSGIRGNTVLATGQWHFVAATWDGTTAKIYVNGVLDNSPGTAKAAPIPVDTRPLYIGGRSGADLFDGMIRDVRIYNRPLTAAELVAGAGLVGHWKFAEGTGTSAADSSGLANNAILSGGATWTSDCTGNNNALLTNGTGGIAQTATHFVPPSVGTVAFWMRSTGAPAGVGRLLGVGPDWEIRQGSNGLVISDLSGDGDTTIGTVTPLTEVGRWYHFAATYDASTKAYAIYVDGQLEKSGTNANAMSQQPAAVISFGTRTGSTEYWSGALRDVRVYNRKLCPTEIAELSGLVGHWKMDETSGTMAADSSGLGRNGSVVGTPTWTTGKLDNAIQLNGSNRVEVNSLLGSPKNVTLAAWANLTAADSGGAELIGLGDYLVIRLNDGSASKAFFYNGSSWISASTSQTFTGAGWHHFAAVYNDDQNTCKFYVDGVEKASVNATTTLPYSGLGTKTVIGAHGNGQTSYDFSGKIDDVRVYSRALCPTEIQKLGSGSPFGGVKIIKWVEIQ